jgi:hypothetical protein
MMDVGVSSDASGEGLAVLVHVGSVADKTPEELDPDGKLATPTFCHLTLVVWQTGSCRSPTCFSVLRLNPGMI